MDFSSRAAAGLPPHPLPATSTLAAAPGRATVGEGRFILLRLRM